MQILTAKIFGVLFIIWFLCGCGLVTYCKVPEKQEFYRLREYPYSHKHDCEWKAQSYYYYLLSHGFAKEDVRYVTGNYYHNDIWLGHAWVEVNVGGIANYRNIYSMLQRYGKPVIISGMFGYAPYKEKKSWYKVLPTISETNKKIEQAGFKGAIWLNLD